MKSGNSYQFIHLLLLPCHYMDNVWLIKKYVTKKSYILIHGWLLIQPISENIWISISLNWSSTSAWTNEASKLGKFPSGLATQLPAGHFLGNGYQGIHSVSPRPSLTSGPTTSKPSCSYRIVQSEKKRKDFVVVPISQRFLCLMLLFTSFTSSVSSLYHYKLQNKDVIKIKHVDYMLLNKYAHLLWINHLFS